ncbi:MAG: fluoride efflux transporter CrcB [Candidatus Poseidoniaceae archaeon]|nr:fluoride efflux transporter CrcB [Candidatus Poseidoniaceae archaeon]|tara:strand:+ start:1413 stop:1790 length:378 start_codon:yes stop_codon:yes gene_type:complete
MEAKILIYIAFGGAIGAVLRYLFGQWLTTEEMPWGTLTVNLVGSLLLGALMGAAANNEVISKEMVMFLGIGILGAFTTLSTYSFETIELWRQGETTRSLLYAGTTAVIGPLLALLGWLGAERFIA